MVENLSGSRFTFPYARSVIAACDGDRESGVLRGYVRVARGRGRDGVIVHARY